MDDIGNTTASRGACSFATSSIVAAAHWLLAAAIVIVGVVAASSASAQPASHRPATASLIVRYAPGLSTAEQAALAHRHGGTERSAIAALRLHVIEVPPDQVDRIAAAMRADPQVARAEINRTRKSAATPNDPLYSSQWALPQIGWDQVFNAPPTASVVVALLDTGIDATHPDLAAKVIAGTSILDGSDGLSDPSGHGTRVAGIVAARTDTTPAEGIAGVAYAGVRVMPVTVLASDGTGQDSDVIAGVMWAADHGADVILMPFSASDYSESLQDAIDYAWSKDIVLVAAVGNDGVNALSFPAGDRGVIGVSATDESDNVASFSNSGLSVFLAAPGTNVVTTDLAGKYSTTSGTSSAAAIVAGVAAQLWAFDPTLTNGVIVGRLARSADSVGTQDQTGNGRVNFARAFTDTGSDFIQPAGSPPVGPGGPFVGPYRAAGSATVSGTVRDASNNPISGATVACATVCSGTTTSAANGAYSLSVNFSGNSATVSITASHPDFLSQTLTGINVSNAINPTNQNFNLAPKHPTSTTWGPASGSVAVNGTQSFTITVADTAASGQTTPTGTVTFSSAAGVSFNPATCTLSGGTCSVIVTGSSSNNSPYTLNAHYNSDATHATSSGTATLIVLHTTTTAVSCASPVLPNVASTCTITVTDTASVGATTPTGAVNLTASGAGVSPPSTSCTLSGSGTSATCSMTFTGSTTGTINVLASYVGDPTHATSSGSGSISVALHTTTTSVSCATTVVGVASTCTITVTDTSSGATGPSGTVALTASGAGVSPTSTSCSLSGSGTSRTCSANFTTAATGTVNVNASYGGDSTHAASSGSGSITVSSRATTTSLSCTSPIAIGASSTCTATTTDTSAGAVTTPTGNVNVSASGGGVSPTSASCALSGSGSTASCTVTLTGGSQGTISVTASYAGDGTHATSSGNASIDVRRASSTSVSCPTVVLGQASNCTITVNDTTTQGQKPTPTGIASATASGAGVSPPSASCTLSGSGPTATCSLSFTGSAVGTITVTATYAGDANHTGSAGTGQITVNPSTQVITVNQHAPLSAVFGTTFNVAATGGGSGNPVTIAGSGACSGSGNNSATITMTSGTGTCSVTYDQAGNAIYSAASQVTETTNAQPASQAISVTQHAPASAVFGTTFNVAATGGASGNPISIAGSGACAGSGNNAATLTMTGGTGTCTVAYNQAGNSNYAAASQVTETTTAHQASQTISFAPLADKHYGDPDFGVAATGGAAGTPVTFTAAGSCSVSGSAVHITGVGSCTITAHQAGNADYSAAADVPQSFNITDNTPPDTSVDSGPSTPTNNSTATFTFSGTDDVTPSASLTFECKLDAGSYAACTSPTTYNGVTEGAHTFYVAAKDAAGNVDPTPAQFSWSVDMTAPDVIIDSMPQVLTNQAAATFAFHASEPGSSLECRVDAGVFTACTSPVTYNGLIEGAHTFYARAKDQAGNQGAATSFSWTIDVTVPTEALDTTPQAITSSNSATFTFHANESATFTCKLDLAPEASCTSPAAYTGLAAGLHTFTVTATDGAGNGSAPQLFQWLIDMQAPDTTITSGPAEGSTTTDTSATFEFTGTDDFTQPADLVFECRLDGAAFAACTSPVQYSGLSRTGHTFAVRAKDFADNTDATPDTRSWTITQIAQTIAFSALPDKTFGGSDFTVTATASSGLPVTFTANGNCTVSGNTVHITGAGSCTITGSQSGDSDYSAAPDVSRTFAIAKANQATLTVTGPTSVTFGATGTATASGGSGTGAVTFSAAGSTGCAVSGTTVSVSNASGTCSLTATKAADNNFNEATSAPFAVTLVKANQAPLYLSVPASITYGTTGTATVSGGSGSGAVTFSHTGSTGCSIDANSGVITVGNASGTCSISASKAGDNNYNGPVTAGPKSVALVKADQASLNLSVPASITYGTSGTATVSGGSGTGAVSFSHSGSTGCSIDANSGVISVSNASGTCSVSASKAGDNNYNGPVTDGPKSVTLVKASQAPLYLSVPPSVMYGTTGNATVSGGSGTGAVTFSNPTSTGCAVDANSGVISVGNASGTCSISASKAGDNNYNGPVTDGPKSVALVKAEQAPLNLSVPASIMYGTTGTATVSGGSGSGAVSFSHSGSTGCSIDANSGVISVSNASGTCSIAASKAGDNNYNSASAGPAAVALVKANQATLTVTGPTSVTYGTTGTATASGGSGSGGVTFSSSGTGCSVYGTTVSVTDASGTCSLTATKAGDNNYNQATSVAFGVTLLKANQAALSVTGPMSVTFGTVGTATASGGSGSGGVTFSSSGTGCLVYGTTVSVNDASGTCSLTATKAGDNNYNSVTSAAFPVTLVKAPQTPLVLSVPASITYGYTGAATTAGGSGTGARYFSHGSSTGCTVNSGTGVITVTDASGSCSITASKAGDNNYLGPVSDGPKAVTLVKANQAALNLTVPVSITYGYTGAATTSGGSGNGAVTYSNAGSTGCAVDANSGVISVSNASGSCSITAYKAGDNNYNGPISSGSKNVPLNKKALTITANPATSQYSDPLAALTAVVTGLVPGDAGVATLATTATPTSAPGAYPITFVSGSWSASNYAYSYTGATYTVVQEDARADYSGNSLFWAPTASSTTANVTLAATIRDITAVSGDPAYDANAGDVRNALVTFIDRATNAPVAGCSNVAVVLISPSDPKAGTALCNTSLAIGSTGATQYVIGLRVNGYYTRNDPGDDAVIDVAQPITTNFITGGGYLMNTASSSGQYAGTPGMKTNFGFNVKYNKSGTNLQGNMNVIARSGGRLYQFKGTSMTSLGIQYCQADGSGNIIASSCGPAPTGACTTSANATCPILANFTSKGNIQDITIPGQVVSIDGNATLQVTMTDRGEPGSTDSIALTVFNKSGGLAFSSKWTGTATGEQVLGGGNLVAH